MAQPHPSLTLVLDVDERLDTEDLRLEVGRCYAHVCPTLVRTHPAGARAHADAGSGPAGGQPANGQPADGRPVNVARFLVKMGTRVYLDPSVKGADELWSNVMERWIRNQLHKVGNNVRIFNRRQRDEGRPELSFDWMELELQNGQLSVLLRCDSTGAVDPDAAALVTAVRNAYGAGRLGQGAARVLLPAPAAYERQRAAGLAAKAQRQAEAAKRAQDEACRKAEQAEAAEREAAESFLESPRLAAEQATANAPGDAAGSGRKAEAGGPQADGNEDTHRFDADEADFALDYRTWQVEYTDGSARTFDSRTGAFAAEAEVEDETEGAAESACAATNDAPAQPASAR